MAIFSSNLVRKKTRNRGLYAGIDNTRSGRIFLAAGTVLTAGDDLLFMPLGENLTVKKVTILAVGNIGAVAGSVGRFQMLDSAGNPVTVERMGPYGEAEYTFTSPATDATAYKAAAALAGYTEQIVAAAVKELGPVHVGIRITTGGTIAADTELFLGTMFAGETSTTDVNADYIQGYSDNGYLIGQ